VADKPSEQAMGSFFVEEESPRGGSVEIFYILTFFNLKFQK
jgi:hypothetical protein